MYNDAIIVELDDGTRGVIYLGNKKMKRYNVGMYIEKARCIKVFDSVGIALLHVTHLESGKQFSGLEIGAEVTFTVAKIEPNYLHGYLDRITPDGTMKENYAFVPRVEAGQKYSRYDDFLLTDNFYQGEQLPAHILEMSSGKVKLTLKSTPEKYALYLKEGNLVKGRIVRLEPMPANGKKPYYLLEWDEFVGMMPLEESSYQPVAPLFYLPGEEIMTKIYGVDNESGLPLLSFRKCNPNPFLTTKPVVGDEYDAKLLGVSNGNLILSFPGGFRAFLRIVRHCSTHEQYEQLLDQTTIKVRLVEIKKAFLYLNLAMPFPMGTKPLKGTEVYATIFQIEYNNKDVQGYDAFSDDGLLLWIPNYTNENHKLEIRIGDRILVRITTNPFEDLIHATFVV